MIALRYCQPIGEKRKIPIVILPPQAAVDRKAREPRTKRDKYPRATFLFVHDRTRYINLPRRPKPECYEFHNELCQSARRLSPRFGCRGTQKSSRYVLVEDKCAADLVTRNFFLPQHMFPVV